MNELIYVDEKFPSYNIIEVLSDNLTSRAFLAERADKLYVIKEQPKKYALPESLSVFRELDFPGLPKIVDFCETEESFFYSYEYINGATLTEAYESGLITRSAAVGITEKLCAIVSYLHGKSLLHCDIKPDNVIINGNSVFLIDFGISRIFNKTGGGDTAIVGTEGFVTPELGYKKTDFRADVYALGMVLFYLLSGSTDIKELPEKVKDRPLRAIINRAANYNVEKRYKTVLRFQNALRKYQKGTAYNPLLRVITAACFVLCFIGGGLIFPTLSENAAAFFGKPQAYEFSDPLIEEAICISLGKTAGEAVYPNELLSVEHIYFAGDRAFGSWEEQEAYLISFYESGKSPPYGVFSSVSDITACKNLKTLSIQFNMLDNLDFLDEIKLLRTLKLTSTNVADISAIKNLPTLEYLSLDACPVLDLSPIKDCALLDNIVLYHINAVNYDFLTAERIYSDIAIGYVHYEKFMKSLSGITTRRLTVVDCNITEADAFADTTVTEFLDVRDKNFTILT
jgi:predicted Ser/Thr protein kinase